MILYLSVQSFMSHMNSSYYQLTAVVPISDACEHHCISMYTLIWVIFITL